MPAFSPSYGAMWSTSSALIAFVPCPENVPRVLAVTFPFGTIGTVLLNVITGILYDQQANESNNVGGSCLNQIGRRCALGQCRSLSLEGPTLNRGLSSHTWTIFVLLGLPWEGVL